MTEVNEDNNYCQETRTKKYINFAVLPHNGQFYSHRKHCISQRSNYSVILNNYFVAYIDGLLWNLEFM